VKEKILFVDDEPNVLDAIRRQLGRRVMLDTATSGEQGLSLIETAGPYAVVVSDMRMPGMTGSQFLMRVRELAPDSVRMILTGQADMQATIDAVNDGQIFRFLTKPCTPDTLWSVLESGLKQHRLITAERDLLERTLGGAVNMLTEVLGLTNPAAFSRALRVQRYAQAIAEAISVGNHWEIRLAAMLSQVGCITLPAGILTRAYGTATLSPDEKLLYESHPELAARLISSIPRLELVAEIVAGQMQRPNLSGSAPLPERWDARLLGQTVLYAAVELDARIAGGALPQVALQKIVESWPELPQGMADAWRAIRMPAGDLVVQAISLSELAPGMILDEDLTSRNGIRLVPQGHEVTNTVMARLRSVAAAVGIREPFRVRVQV